MLCASFEERKEEEVFRMRSDGPADHRLRISPYCVCGFIYCSFVISISSMEEEFRLDPFSDLLADSSNLSSLQEA